MKVNKMMQYKALNTSVFVVVKSESWTDGGYLHVKWGCHWKNPKVKGNWSYAFPRGTLRESCESEEA